jgi:FKBP-type peptidyl-prolyl cis-trans isomerase SlyD
MSNAVGDDTVVTITYALYNEEDDVFLEEIGEGEALSYLHGHNNIVPGLEEALAGLGAGDSFDVVVPPDKGYGERQDELVTEVDRDQLPLEEDVEEGDWVHVETKGDRPPEQWQILDIGEDSITVDANAPLAGLTLRFEGEVLEIRDANDEELEAGQPLQ